MVRFAVILALSLTLFSCKRELTPQQQEQLGNLRQELISLDEEIAAAKADDARYAGGLVKALIAARIEVLKTNRELVNQRLHAIEAGATIEVKVGATRPDPARAAELAEEIRGQQLELALAEAKAKQHGGLVGALGAATVATQEQTLAMLRQSYLQTKYGLNYPEVGKIQPAEAMRPTQPPAPEPVQTSAPSETGRSLELLAVMGERDRLRAGLDRCVEKLNQSATDLERAVTDLSSRIRSGGGSAPAPAPSSFSGSTLETPRREEHPERGQADIVMFNSPRTLLNGDEVTVTGKLYNRGKVPGTVTVAIEVYENGRKRFNGEERLVVHPGEIVEWHHDFHTLSPEGNWTARAWVR